MLTDCLIKWNVSKANRRQRIKKRPFAKFIYRCAKGSIATLPWGCEENEWRRSLPFFYSFSSFLHENKPIYYHTWFKLSQEQNRINNQFVYGNTGNFFLLIFTHGISSRTETFPTPNHHCFVVVPLPSGKT